MLFRKASLLLRKSKYSVEKLSKKVSFFKIASEASYFSFNTFRYILIRFDTFSIILYQKWDIFCDFQPLCLKIILKSLTLHHCERSELRFHSIHFNTFRYILYQKWDISCDFQPLWRIEEKGKLSTKLIAGKCVMAYFAHRWIFCWLNGCQSLQEPFKSKMESRKSF